MATHSRPSLAVASAEGLSLYAPHDHLGPGDLTWYILAPLEPCDGPSEQDMGTGWGRDHARLGPHEGHARHQAQDTGTPQGHEQDGMPRAHFEHTPLFGAMQC